MAKKKRKRKTVWQEFAWLDHASLPEDVQERLGAVHNVLGHEVRVTIGGGMVNFSSRKSVRRG